MDELVAMKSKRLAALYLTIAAKGSPVVGLSLGSPALRQTFRDQIVNKEYVNTIYVQAAEIAPSTISLDKDSMGSICLIHGHQTCCVLCFWLLAGWHGPSSAVDGSSAHRVNATTKQPDGNISK